MAAENESTIQQVVIEEHGGLSFEVINEIGLHKSSGKSKDVDEFVDLLKVSLEEQYRRDGVPKDKQLQVKWAFPKELIEKPGKGLNLVICSVKSRNYKNTSPDRTRRPRSPVEHEIIDYPNKPDLAIQLSSQYFETEMLFTVICSDSSELQKNAIFFESFMYNWKFYFKDMGINEYYYLGRDADEVNNKVTVELYTAKLRFMVITNKVYAKVFPKYKSISISYDVGEITRTPGAQPGISTYSAE